MAFYLILKKPTKKLGATGAVYFDRRDGSKSSRTKKQRPYFGEAICENVLHNHVGIGSKGLLVLLRKQTQKVLKACPMCFLLGSLPRPMVSIELSKMFPISPKHERKNLSLHSKAVNLFQKKTVIWGHLHSGFLYWPPIIGAPSHKRDPYHCHTSRVPLVRRSGIRE